MLMLLASYPDFVLFSNALFFQFVLEVPFLSFYYRPDLVDMSRVSTQTNRSNLENAFGVAEQLGVARLLDPEGENLTHCHIGMFNSRKKQTL